LKSAEETVLPIEKIHLSPSLDLQSQQAQKIPQARKMADLLGQVAQQLKDLQSQLTAAREEIGRLTEALASKVRSTPHVEDT
jgi:hypothetical protein